MQPESKSNSRIQTASSVSELHSRMDAGFVTRATQFRIRPQGAFFLEAFDVPPLIIVIITVLLKLSCIVGVSAVRFALRMMPSVRRRKLWFKTMNDILLYYGEG